MSLPKNEHPLIRRITALLAGRQDLSRSRHLTKDWERKAASAFFFEQSLVQAGIIEPTGRGQRGLKGFWTTPMTGDSAAIKSAIEKAKTLTQGAVQDPHFSDQYKGDAEAAYRDAIAALGKVMHGTRGSSFQTSGWLKWTTEAKIQARLHTRDNPKK